MGSTRNLGLRAVGDPDGAASSNLNNGRRMLFWGRRLLITLLGFSVLLIGLAMIVLPGPSIVVIPLGLAILGTEFLWARKMLQRIREKLGTLSRGMGKKSPDSNGKP